MRGKVVAGGVVGLAALALILGLPQQPSSRRLAPESPRQTTSRVRHVQVQQALPDLPHVAGRVLFNGAPVAGASVHVWPGVGTATTDENGRFDLGAAPYRARIVVASAPRRRATSLALPDGSARSQLELVLGTCDTTLSGSVRDAAGGMIPRPHLSGIGLGGLIAAEGFGDDDGSFVLCVRPGTVYVDVRASGYANLSESVEVPVSRQHDFTLVPEAVVEGRVVDPAGDPVSAALVSGTRGVFAFSDDSGRFRLHGAESGESFVHCSAPDYGDAILTIHPTIEHVTTVECRLEGERRISGRVMGSDGPAAGLIIGTGGRSSTVTAADGSFLLPHVAESARQLVVRDHDIVTQEPDPMALKGDVAGVLVRVKPRPSTSVAGRVVHDGRPVANATVRLFNGTTSDADGSFVVRNVMPGKAHIMAETPDGCGSDWIELMVEEGEARTGVTLDLNLCGAISGVVVHPDGEPVPGAVVRLVGGGEQGEVVAGADGRFQVGTLVGGRTYAATVFVGTTERLELRPAGGRPRQTVFVAGRYTKVDGFRLVVERADAQIAGRVTDESGAPVLDAIVGVARSDLTESGLAYNWEPLARSATDSDGRFVLRGVPHGKQLVVARAPNDDLVSLPGVESGAKDIVLVLPARGQIAGRIEGSTENLTVSAIDRFGKSHPCAVDGDRFHVEGLPRGPAVVSMGRGRSGTVGGKRVEVSPPTVTEITLRPFSMHPVRGHLIDSSGAASPGTCQLELGLGWQIAEVEVPADGHFRFAVPIGEPTILTCYGPGFVAMRHLAPADGDATAELTVMP